MLSDESRQKYKTLLIGVAIGSMLGFIFGIFVSGHLPTDPIAGLARIEPVYTTFFGCFIAIAFALVYLYISEWSKNGGVKKEKPREAGTE